MDKCGWLWSLPLPHENCQGFGRQLEKCHVSGCAGAAADAHARSRRREARCVVAVDGGHGPSAFHIFGHRRCTMRQSRARHSGERSVSQTCHAENGHECSRSNATTRSSKPSERPRSSARTSSSVTLASRPRPCAGTFCCWRIGAFFGASTAARPASRRPTTSRPSRSGQRSVITPSAKSPSLR